MGNDNLFADDDPNEPHPDEDGKTIYAEAPPKQVQAVEANQAPKAERNTNLAIAIVVLAGILLCAVLLVNAPAADTVSLTSYFSALNQMGQRELVQPAQGETTQSAQDGTTQPTEGELTQPALGETTQSTQDGTTQSAQGELVQPAQGETTQSAQDGTTQPTEGEPTQPVLGQPTVSSAPANPNQNINWQWVSVTDPSTGQTTTVSNPQQYTLAFTPEGFINGIADCNSFTGTYSQENGLTLTVTTMTMAACPQGSLDQQYLQLLGSIAAGGPDGTGSLALETAGGAQRMLFQNGGPAQ